MRLPCAQSGASTRTARSQSFGAAACAAGSACAQLQHAPPPGSVPTQLPCAPLHGLLQLWAGQHGRQRGRPASGCSRHNRVKRAVVGRQKHRGHAQQKGDARWAVGGAPGAARGARKWGWGTANETTARGARTAEAGSARLTGFRAQSKRASARAGATARIAVRSAPLPPLPACSPQRLQQFVCTGLAEGRGSAEARQPRGDGTLQPGGVPGARAAENALRVARPAPAGRAAAGAFRSCSRGVDVHKAAALECGLWGPLPGAHGERGWGVCRERAGTTRLYASARGVGDQRYVSCW
jgi:hypothetical protein